MRVAIIGTGFMGKIHAEAWSQTDARLVAFVGKKGAEGKTLADAYGLRFATTLEAVASDIDVVDICTPTHLHPEHCLRAAAAAKHVICEKPLALTVADGQRMIQACRTAWRERSRPEGILGNQLCSGCHAVRFAPARRITGTPIRRGPGA